MHALAQWQARLEVDAAAVARASTTAVAGVIGGAAGLGLAVLSHARAPERVALTVALAVVLFALPRATLGLRGLMLGASLFVTVVGPWREVALPFTLAGGTGLLLMLEHETWGRRLVAAGGALGGAAWAGLVVAGLSSRHLGNLAALGLVAALAGGVFVALGALAAHVEVAADAVEPRLRAAPKLAHAWARWRRAAARLPAGHALGRLQRLVVEGVERWEATRRERAALDASLASSGEVDTRAALAAAQEALAAAQDELLRGELARICRVHSDTLEQVEGLRRRLERLDACAAREVAWLETAALSAELTPPTAEKVADLAARLERL